MPILLYFDCILMNLVGMATESKLNKRENLCNY